MINSGRFGISSLNSLDIIGNSVIGRYDSTTVCFKPDFRTVITPDTFQDDDKCLTGIWDVTSVVSLLKAFFQIA